LLRVLGQVGANHSGIRRGTGDLSPLRAAGERPEETLAAILSGMLHGDWVELARFQDDQIRHKTMLNDLRDVHSLVNR